MERLRTLGWFTGLLHVFALSLAGLFLRPGSILAPAAERAAYIAAEPWAWKLSWAVWVVAALAFLVFQVGCRRALPGPLTRWAMLPTLLAVVTDLSCDWMWIVDVPAAAAAGADFSVIESRAFFGGSVIANGLYTVAVLLTGLALPRHRVYTAAVVVTGFGFSLVAALFWPTAIVVLSGATILTYSVWAVRVTYP